MALVTTRRLEEALRGLDRPDKPRRMDFGGSGGLWATDYVWVGGKRLAIPENTSNYKYLRVYLDGTTEPEWIETAPETQAEDSEVYDMTKMQIHLPGNFA